jgi:hypothetical protein
MCAISGAIQWSIDCGRQLPYWYYGSMNYLVPLYLQSRENITLAPDLIAPVQVNPGSLLVRTILAQQCPTRTLAWRCAAMINFQHGCSQAGRSMLRAPRRLRLRIRSRRRRERWIPE